MCTRKSKYSSSTITVAHTPHPLYCHLQVGCLEEIDAGGVGMYLKQQLQPMLNGKMLLCKLHTEPIAYCL